jgi:hypothetical protein
LFPQQVGIADDGGKDVVEIVGDAAGEEPDGLHLLGLHQLGLELPLFILGDLSLVDIEAEDRDAAHQDDDDPQGRGNENRTLGRKGDRAVDNDGLPRERAVRDAETDQLVVVEHHARRAPEVHRYA